MRGRERPTTHGLEMHLVTMHKAIARKHTPGNVSVLQNRIIVVGFFSEPGASNIMNDIMAGTMLTKPTTSKRMLVMVRNRPADLFSMFYLRESLE